MLRLPLQPGKESLASEVEQSYQRVYRAAGSGRRSVIYLALVIFVGLPVATALIWFIAKFTGCVQ